MLVNKTFWRLGAIALIGSAFTLAAACSGGDGVSKEDYDKVQQQLQDKQTENEQLQKQVTDLQGGSATPTDGVINLLGAQKLAPPSPTPVPTGSPAPAPPRETPSASFYDSTVGPYYIYVETLATTTRSKYDVASTVSCTASATFARGQRIVWRFEVVDTATARRVTDKDENVTLKLVLPNGDEATPRFSQRGGGRVPGAPFMWSANWDIPLDYPLGAIDYKILITKDGQTTTWKPLALVSETNNTLPKVVQ